MSMKLLPSELEVEYQQVVAQNQALLQEMYARSAPRIAEMIDAINGLTNAADQGNAGAKQALQAFISALDRARRSSGKIVIP